MAGGIIRTEVRTMLNRSSLWDLCAFGGLALFVLGLVAPVEARVSGYRVAGLVSLFGLLLALSAVAWGLVTAIRRRAWRGLQSVRSSTGTAAAVAAGAAYLSDDFPSYHYRGPAVITPAFNVDGTPMMNALTDMEGKVYGDAGHHHSYGTGGDSYSTSFGGSHHD